MMLYGALWGPMGPYGGPMGPYGALWGPMEPYGALWGPMGPYGALWGPMGPYGALWGPMVTKNLEKSKSPKIGPNRVLMVRFDAESPQEFDSDPGEARGGHLK